MLPTEYSTPESLRTLANWLRSDNGVKVRSGIEHEKRVEYFKGDDNNDKLVDKLNGWKFSLNAWCKVH